MSLLAELKRRNVFKVGVAYLVVAWLVIQVASTVAPQLNLPEWTPRLITLVTLLGFPVALVLAWAFERTPEGIRLDPAGTGNRHMGMIAAVLALAALGWYFRAELPGGKRAAEHPRLALLPLANFSPAADDAFFADGLHDDMLTALSRMKGVDVISRTTMQTFKDSKKKLSEIAAEVGASHVLEGSVRRDAQRVRLTVQLIDAKSDRHLWAEAYDRPLSDALTLQAAVAKEVARALEVALDAGGSAAPTTVPAAYDLYLKARLERRGGRLKYLDAALLLDPKFALARAQRAASGCETVWFEEARRGELAPQVESDLGQLRREHQGLIELDWAEAFCTYYLRRDYAKALVEIERVLLHAPNHADSLRGRGLMLRRLGRGDEALAAFRRALELDPGNQDSIENHALTHIFVRHYREAIALFDEAIARFPESYPLQSGRAIAVAALTGDASGELAALERARGHMPEDEWEGRRWFLSKPSPERLAATVARGENWRPSSITGPFPLPLEAARVADAIGDVAQRERSAAQAARMYATLDTAVLMRPGVRMMRADMLSLQGNAKEAIAEAEAALASSPATADAMLRPWLERWGALVFARAGAPARALDLLEAVDAAPFSTETGASIRDDHFLRHLLAAEPRYQALIKKIESRFEPL